MNNSYINSKLLDSSINIKYLCAHKVLKFNSHSWIENSCESMLSLKYSIKIQIHTNNENVNLALISE